MRTRYGILIGVAICVALAAGVVLSGYRSHAAGLRRPNILILETDGQTLAEIGR